MNQSQQAERIREAVDAYVDEIAIPDYHAAALRARLPRNGAPRLRVRWVAILPAAAALVALVVIFSSPMVIAQVERMLHAFASIDGQPVPVAVNSVTLDQARDEMPFAVIAPAAIPAGLNESINELVPSTSRFDSRLLFQFTSGNQPPLTIMESRANARTPEQLRLWMTMGKGPSPGGMPTMPPGLPKGQKAFVAFRSDNGQVTRQVRLEPITWIVRGTRVELISPPGLLSDTQLLAIRRAMSR